MAQISPPPNPASKPEPGSAGASPTPRIVPTGPAARPSWINWILGQLRTVRDTMTPEQLVSSLKTLIWVVPLTLLIWIYAEREQVQKAPGVTFPIEVRSSAPDRIVRLIKPADANVVAELSGPRARLDKVRDMITPGGGNTPIIIDVPATLSPGRLAELNTSNELNRHPTFANNGITLRDTRPDAIQVFVDELVVRQARVEAPPAVKNLEGPPVFEPASVEVRGPASVLDSVPGGRVVVYADIANLPQLRQPGQHELTEVPLTRNFGSGSDDHITLSVSRVNATVRVKESNIEYEYPAMPVWATMPQELQGRYRVEFDPVLTNVTLIGPPETIEMLRRPDSQLRPKARLEVTADDVGEQRYRRPQFDLPEGVTVAPRDQQREIAFELVPLESVD